MSDQQLRIHLSEFEWHVSAHGFHWVAEVEVEERHPIHRSQGTRRCSSALESTRDLQLTLRAYKAQLSVAAILSLGRCANRSSRCISHLCLLCTNSCWLCCMPDLLDSGLRLWGLTTVVQMVLDYH